MVTATASKHILNRLTGDYESSTATVNLAQRAVTTDALGQILYVNESGLSAVAVIAVVGSLILLWVLTVMVGIMCKYFNKPRSALHSGAYANGGLYRPSAAAYGDKGGANLTAPDPKKMFGSKSSLIAGASPMGRAGSPGALDSPDVSRDDFEMPRTNHAGRAAGQHNRTSSSSIGMPGPPAASRRAGLPGQQHPHMATSGGTNAPDGSRFQPTQVYNAAHQPSGFASQVFAYPPGPSGPHNHEQGGSSSSAQGGGVMRSNSKVTRGPPPARSNSKRRSRYNRPARVDSLGPGEIRRFLDETAGEEEGDENQDGSPVNYSRRSMTGRRSQYGIAGRNGSVGGGRMPRSPSIYGAQEVTAIKTAQAEGFGGGQGGTSGRQQSSTPQQQVRLDPLGGSQQRAYNTGAAAQQAARPAFRQMMRPGGAAPPSAVSGQAPGAILQSRPPPPVQYQQQHRSQGSGASGIPMRYPTGPPAHLQGPPRPQQNQQQYPQQQWMSVAGQPGNGPNRGTGPQKGPPPPNAYRQPQLAQGGGGMRQIL